MGITFNNTLDKDYRPYTPNIEDYRRVWNVLDINQNCNGNGNDNDNDKGEGKEIRSQKFLYYVPVNAF